MVRNSARKAPLKALSLLLAAALLCLPAAPVRADAPLEPVQPGDFVITEVMYSPPQGIEFPMGQWFEVYNAADDARTLAGLTLEILPAGTDGASSYVVEWAVAPVVEGHGFAVLGASKALAINGGVPVAYAYGPAFVLPKQGGKLRIVLPDGSLVDEITWGPGLGPVAPPGSSVNLEPEGMSAEANDLALYWCESTFAFDAAKPSLMATPGTVGHPCDSDNDGFDEASGDCDDLEAKVSPGAQEKCNGIDDDCSGEVDDGPLLDAPTWAAVGVCEQGGPVCLGAEGWELDYPAVWEEVETACDYLDNDCDGEVDEGLRNSCGNCGEDPLDLCDGIDNDCDGKTDEDALTPPEEFACDGGKTGLCKETKAVCAGADGWMCVHPVGYEEEELSCDGFDNDCDGEIDEGYAVGEGCLLGEGACRNDGVYVCSPDRLGVVCKGEAQPGLIELCGDNIDNDCDGETDEGFPVGETCEVGVGACEVTGKYFCSEDRLQVVCSVEAFEPLPEVCGNAVDDDCDGEVDEGPCDDVDPTGGGCGVGALGTSALTFLALLFIPMLAPGFRRFRRRLSSRS
jgi:hypothetical protein